MSFHRLYVSCAFIMGLFLISISSSNVFCDEGSGYDLGQLVVTATRSPQPAKEVPSVVEVVSRHDINETVGWDLSQVLKKNTSIDVIEYPGALSGIGIRGFRPEFSGITKHSLLLINGHPAGATNLSTILMDDVERIEVLKGPASSLYGAEAMGGVVNVITRKSRGPIRGSVKAGGGSFDTWYGDANLGGNAFRDLDFDLTASTRNQNADMKLGGDHGRRPGTTFNIGYGSLRLGSDIYDNWRLDVRGDYYYGNDIETPGALFYDDRQQSQKDIERYGGSMHLEGAWGKNKGTLVIYASKESNDYYKKYQYLPSSGGYVPVSPYHSFYSEKKWWGTQIQDLYKFMDRHDIIVGFDYQSIDEESKSYNQDGSRRAPWSPDANRKNKAVFTDTIWRFLDERLIVTAGLRYDYFDVETKHTPYKTDFHPGSESFDTISPRMGLRFNLNELLNFHTTVGKAFVPPTASQMAGYSERMVKGTTMITRGNPDLDPETSWTWDGGIGSGVERIGLSSDVTVFFTSVDDKITAVTRGNVSTYENTSDAGMAGLEFKIAWDAGKAFQLGRRIRLFANGTRLFYSREHIQHEGWRDIHNVPHWKVNYGLDYDDGMFNGRILARYIGKRKDNDWYSPGYPVITYGDFTVVDMTLGVTFKDHHINLKINNLFDKYYYEKPEFPLAGRAWYLEYRWAF